MDQNQNTAPNNVEPSTPNTSNAGSKMKINKTVLLVIGLVILTILLLVISLSGKVSNPLTSLTENSTMNAGTILSVSEEMRLNEDGKYELDINIDSEEGKISSAQIELSYDPNVITDMEIAPGGFLNNPTILEQKVDSETGRITLTLGSSLDAEPVEGSGVLAILTFTKDNDTETVIEVLPETIVASEGENILKESISATISTLPESSE